MILSLNEVEAMAKKAARGAGYSWGMAEEAGRATRWLCAQSQPGGAALAALLTRLDPVDMDARAPRSLDDWGAGDAPMCPLLAGASFCDAVTLLPDAPLTMRAVAQPLLLLPFLAQAARQGDTAFSLTFDGVMATTDGQGLDISGNPDAETVDVVITRSSVTCPDTSGTRAEIDAGDWDTLGRFAHRTYAPATEASRRLGAGTDLSDND
ncbi:DUF3726 domain-containing protein [Aliiroseovarius subalbicans]|uniref:DUF3726 domain-containing protein n=1 Tax=Aliiroseovarius subalbicans TaxID=2925840 RepID=UPI001F562452|nr:DUF3726 domain-containing protein [Aliiroseovarius subalbicans]MCI2398512.1 DUF3726 domain-containing protein [Aliiroseovarius subalbicans]